MAHSLGKRIAFGQIIAFLFFLVLSTLIVFYLLNIKNNNIVEIKSNFTHYSQSQKIKLNVIQIQQFISDIGATRAENGLDDGLSEAKNHYDELIKILTAERTNAFEEKNSVLISEIDEIKILSESYYTTGVKMANLYIKEGTAAGNNFMPNFDKASSDLQDKVDLLLNKATQNFTSDINKISLQISTILKITFYTTIIVLVVYSIFSFTFIKKITQQIINPIDELISVTPRLISAADSMSSLSSELSSCSTEQAAAVQETAASIEEINAMINKNSEHANTAKDSSRESLNSTRNGQEAINDMILAMDEISKNNDSFTSFISKNNIELNEMVQAIVNIAEKTKVINDIVFQTKLLSFNASVEAARAGEQGKGFAVVADEIGKLAQMSGNAANEIKSELDTSIKKVNDIVNSTKSEVTYLMSEGKEKINIGQEKAILCNSILNEINKSSQTSELMVVEVAIATKEQSQGIAEVNKAMGQIDEATAQNSVASERVSEGAHQVLDLSNSISATTNKLILLVKGSVS